MTDADATPAVPDGSQGSAETAPEDKPVRQRRPRGAAESLGAIVLGFESIVVFLAGLVVYGLKATPPGVEPWWGVVGGAVVAVLMILLSGLLRYRWAIVVGWILQVIVALAAFFVPAILIIALIFGGMWAYATIKGASLDRRNALLARQAASAPESPASPPESSNGV